jgi:Mn2+/Fe2+ NRAMP family transporter
MLMLRSGIPALRMLFWAAVVNGLLAPPLIAVILVVCNDRRVMGEWRNTRTLNALGIAACLAMAAAALALVLLS